MKNLILRMLLLIPILDSCSTNIQSVLTPTSYTDSLLIIKKSIYPDFVIYDEGLDKSVLLNDTNFESGGCSTPVVKIYYGKNKVIKRIVFNDYNFLKEFKKDKDTTRQGVYTYETNQPKSITLDFTDTFKGYKINYSNCFK